MGIGPSVRAPTSSNGRAECPQALDDPVSPPWRGLAVRFTRRIGQRGQHHAPTGSILGYLDQEFIQWNIDVDIIEFEGSLHVGGAYYSRRSAVLPSHPPQFLAFGEGHLPLVVAASDGAFDRDFSGHFLNITTTAPKGPRVHALSNQPGSVCLRGMP